MSIGEAGIIEIHLCARLEHFGGFGNFSKRRKTPNPGLPTPPSLPPPYPAAADVHWTPMTWRERHTDVLVAGAGPRRRGGRAGRRRPRCERRARRALAEDRGPAHEPGRAARRAPVDRAVRLHGPLSRAARRHPGLLPRALPTDERGPRTHAPQPGRCPRERARPRAPSCAGGARGDARPLTARAGGSRCCSSTTSGRHESTAIASRRFRRTSASSTRPWSSTPPRTATSSRSPAPST